MKTILAFILAGLLAAEPLHLSAQSFQGRQAAAEMQTKSVVIVFALTLSVLVVGTYAIFKVSQNIPNQHTPVTLVLESTADFGTWTPIATNTVVLNGQTPLEAFREKMTDPCRFYRARVVKR